MSRRMWMTVVGTLLGGLSQAADTRKPAQQAEVKPIVVRVSRENDFGGRMELVLTCSPDTPESCEIKRVFRKRTLFKGTLTRKLALSYLDPFFSKLESDPVANAKGSGILHVYVRYGLKIATDRRRFSDQAFARLMLMEAQFGAYLKPLTRRPGGRHKKSETVVETLELHPGTIQDFCAHPYVAVCGQDSADPPASERDLAIAGVKDRIKDGALVDAGQAAGVQDPSAYEESDLAALQTSNPTLYKKVYLAYLTKFIALAEKEANDDHLLTQFNFKGIVERMRPDITIFPAPAETRKKMFDIVSQVKLVNASDFLSGKLQGDELKSFQETCGHDGLADNAYASPSEEVGAAYFVVCPGALIAALAGKDADKKERQALMAKNIFMMSHEMGHHIDSDQIEGVYEELQSCLTQNYARDFGQGDAAKYMSEITADAWGTRNIVRYLPKVSEKERLAFAKESLEFLCNTEEDDPTEEDSLHPTGQFRIAFVRRDEQLAELLGCKAKMDEKPTCGFSSKAKDD